MKVRVNTTMDIDLKMWLEKQGIGIHKALEFGVLFKKAELGEMSHPANTLSRKIDKMSQRLEATLRELENAREKIEKLEEKHRKEERTQELYNFAV